MRLPTSLRGVPVAEALGNAASVAGAQRSRVVAELRTDIPRRARVRVLRYDDTPPSGAGDCRVCLRNTRRFSCGVTPQYVRPCW